MIAQFANVGSFKPEEGRWGGAGSPPKEGSEASHRVPFMSGPQELNAFLSTSIKFANIYIRKRKYIEVNIFLKIISIQIRS